MANVVQIVISALDETKDVFEKQITSMKDVEKQAGLMAAGMAGAAIAATAAFSAMVVSAINAADEIGKQAQKVGMTTEAFSSLKYAAEQNEVSSEQLIASFKNLSGQLQEVQAGNEKAAALFDSIGVKATDSSGKIRNLDDVLLDVAQSFKNHADGAQKAAIAQDLFGRSGIDMVPFMNQGRDGIQELANEAQNLGLVISGETAKQADEFNDNLTRLKGSAQGLARQVAADLLPELLRLSQWAVDYIQKSGLVAAGSRTIADGFTYITNATVALYSALKGVLTIPATWINSMVAMGSATVSVFSGIISSVKALATEGPAAANAAMDAALAKTEVHFRTVKALWANMGNDVRAEMQKTAKALESGPARISTPATPTVTTIQKNVVVADGRSQYDAPINQAVVDQNQANAQKIEDAASKMWQALLADSAKSTSDQAQISEARLQAQLEQINRLGVGEDEYYALRQQAFKNHEDRLIAHNENANQKLVDATQKMHDELLSGSAQFNDNRVAQSQRTLEKQLEQIAKLQADEEEYYSMREQAFQNHQDRMLQLKQENELKAQQISQQMAENITEDPIERQRLRAEAAYQERLQQINGLGLAEDEYYAMREKAAQEYEKAIKDVESSKVSIALNAMSSIAAAAKMFGKQGLAAYKAIATTEAVISTALAITKTLASVKWPLNIVAAAGVAAQGAVQIATIQSAGQAHAGLNYVPSEATYILQQGERVLAPRQNEDLTEFLDGSGGGMTRVVVNLDGRAILDYIGEATKTGLIEIDSAAVV